MKKYAAVTALLLILALLCACGRQEPAPQDIPPSGERENQVLYSWDDLWDGPGAEPLALTYAQSFSVDLSEYGYARIIIDGDVYLLVPEDTPLPQGLPEDVTVLQQPIQNIYLQATSSMDCFRQLDALDAIALSGTQADGWYIPEAREAMEAGQILYAGKYSAPDYELIKSKNCGLALESTMIYHTPEVKEQLERFGIPVLVERSSYEVHPLGRMEWIKLYGVLLGKLDEAEAYFDQQLEQLAPILEQENTGKTVAFFAINSNGTVTVRKSGDYIAKAIDLAGGIYAFRDLTSEENALSTMNIQMELFYQTAKDADIVVYNSTIDANLTTIEELLDKSASLGDFKAVQSGDVWCTGKSMFQESLGVGDMILDLHTICAEEDPADEDLHYLHRLT